MYISPDRRQWVQSCPPRELAALNGGFDLVFTEKPLLAWPDFWNFLGYWSCEVLYFLGLVCDFHKGTDVSAWSCLKISQRIPWVFAKLSISVIESEKRSDAPEPGKTGSSASQREPLEFSQWQVPGAECCAASVISLASPWCPRGRSQAWAAWVCVPRSCRMGGLSQAAGSENKLCR